jgi:hypothetical protein
MSLPHLLNDFFQAGLFPHGRIEVELLDDLQQPGAGQDLLVEALDALVCVAGDRGFDKIRRNLLLLDEDGGGGLVHRRQGQGHYRADQDNGQGRPQKVLFAGQENSPVMP